MLFSSCSILWVGFIGQVLCLYLQNLALDGALRDTYNMNITQPDFQKQVGLGLYVTQSETADIAYLLHSIFIKLLKVLYVTISNQKISRPTKTCRNFCPIGGHVGQKSTCPKSILLALI